ncbi:arsenicals resistance [Savitreella phatthalungensis]
MDHATAPPTCRRTSLGIVDKLLWLWILLAMALGIILGYFVPNTSRALDHAKFVGVSAPIAVGLMVMMFPILCKVQYERLHHVFRTREVWRQLAFSIVVNWVIAPLVMVGLAWAFLPDQRDLREGLILVGVARCIAMVLIWTGLADGDNEYCAILVGVNSILQIVLYAPFAILYINKFVPAGQSEDLHISYSTVAASVGAYLGIPVAAAIVVRFGVKYTLGDKWLERVLKFLSPWSLLGLLFTVIVLFASQGKHVVQEIVAVLRVAAPLVVYFAIAFFMTLWAVRRLGFTYPQAVAQGFTASSNNFELAIAVAIATYGIDSRQALAATVGPLIEIPVLLVLVYFFRWVQGRWLWPKGSEKADLSRSPSPADHQRIELSGKQQQQQQQSQLGMNAV